MNGGDVQVTAALHGLIEDTAVLRWNLGAVTCDIPRRLMRLRMSTGLNRPRCLDLDPGAAVQCRVLGTPLSCDLAIECESHEYLAEETSSCIFRQVDSRCQTVGEFGVCGLAEVGRVMVRELIF